MDVATPAEVDGGRRCFWLLPDCWYRRGIAAGTANRNFARFDLVDYQLLAGGFRYGPKQSLETGLRSRARPFDSVDGRTADVLAERSPLRSRTRRHNFAPSSETPRGYVGQAVLESSGVDEVESILRRHARSFCPEGTRTFR